jgi:hypothetical protein
MNNRITPNEKVALITTLGVTTLKELLIKKGVFTRAEWTEAFDTKTDEFQEYVEKKD